MAESPAARMMRLHAPIPNTQTQTIVNARAQEHDCGLHRIRQIAKAQNRISGFKKNHGRGFVLLRESTHADFRKSTKAAHSEHYRL